MGEDLQRRFWAMVGAFLAVDLLSFALYPHPAWFFGATIIILAGILITGWRYPWWPALISVGELINGGQGYLFFIDSGEHHISLRFGLFAIMIILTVKQLWSDQQRWRYLKVWPMIIFAVWIAVMTLVGLTKNHGFSEVWLDMNAYLFLGVIFTWAILLRPLRRWRDDILVVLLAGVMYLGIKSWVLAFIFGHPPENINEIYRWIRNTGVGEITKVDPPVYRIFLQSQIYSLFGLLLGWGAWLVNRAPRWWWWPMFAGALGTYLSLSRSFWLGLAVALLVSLLWSVKSLGWAVLKRGLLIIPIVGGVWLISNWGYYWPGLTPSTGDGASNLIRTRFTAADAKQAADARLNQIGPLWDGIKTAPIWGQGFGQNITYYSTDPRVKGWRTTSAFELGYLDQWLKFGIIGLALMFWLVWTLTRPAIKGSWWPLFLGGTVALVVVHATTPYLNHPLGLGWLALVSLYYDES